jgi:hypothetical protein
VSRGSALVGGMCGSSRGQPGGVAGGGCRDGRSEWSGLAGQLVSRSERVGSWWHGAREWAAGVTERESGQLVARSERVGSWCHGAREWAAGVTERESGQLVSSQSAGEPGLSTPSRACEHAH